MFDDLKDNQSATPVNAGPIGPAPGSAEDIFAEVDKAAKPEVFTPKPNSAPPRGTVIPPEMNWKNNKKIIFGLVFGGLMIVAAGGYLGLKLAGLAKPVDESQLNQVQPENNGAETALPGQTEEVNQPTTPTTSPAETTAPLDSDSDGLTDAEEATLGSDPNLADTDRDGLTDWEEVKVYRTDLLNPDTDGDGFKDGDEIKNGYNPKGPGKLLDFNSAQ